MHIRVRYKGENVRSSRLVAVQASSSGDVTGGAILAALATGGIDCCSSGGRWTPTVYDAKLEGWALLDDETRVFDGQTGPLDVLLSDGLVSPRWQQAPTAQADGYFGVGVVRGKTAENQGTLWRSAYQLGASFTFTIGARFERSKLDTAASWTELPAFSFPTFADFAQAAPFGAVWVAVEMGGAPLLDFVHPQRAVYILGSEDEGLPSDVLKACHHRVSIPAVRTASFNVAVSGSIVLYDRLAKVGTHPVPRPIVVGDAPAPLRDASAHQQAVPASSIKGRPYLTQPKADAGERQAPARESPRSNVHEVRAVEEDRGVSFGRDLDSWWHEEECTQTDESSGQVGDLALRSEPHRRCGRSVLLLRCQPPYRSRLAEYMAKTLGSDMVASSRCLLCFHDFAAVGATGGAVSSHGAAEPSDVAYVLVRNDANMSRAVEGAFLADEMRASLADVIEPVMGRIRRAQQDDAASKVVLRLQAYPRTLKTALLEMLPATIELSPTQYTHILFAVQSRAPGPVYFSLRPASLLLRSYPAPCIPPPTIPGQSLLAEAVRRQLLPPLVMGPCSHRALLLHEKPQHACAQLLQSAPYEYDVHTVAPQGRALHLPEQPDGHHIRFSCCIIDLNVECLRVVPILTEWLPHRMGMLAAESTSADRPWLLANLKFTSLSRDARQRTCSQLIERVSAAGFENVGLHWLFGNGVCERTLICCHMGPGMPNPEGC